MSYILDALKKADQQRQRGAAPSLRSAPEIVPDERKYPAWRFAAPAMALVAAAALLGWWQARPSSESADRQIVVTATNTPASRAAAPPTPRQSFPAAPSTPAPSLPLPSPLQNATPSKPAPSESIHASPPAVVEETSGAEPQAARILMIDELPLPVRQSLPAMTVSLHAWSATPTSRIVSINSQLLHEGDSPAAGVSLEEITPDGMIMTFRGYRFRHGVR